MRIVAFWALALAAPWALPTSGFRLPFPTQHTESLRGRAAQGPRHTRGSDRTAISNVQLGLCASIPGSRHRTHTAGGGSGDDLHASRNYPNDYRYRKHRSLYEALASPLTNGTTHAGAEDGAYALINGKPKVLSPAGGWPQLRAAARAGADCVYFGCDAGLNARARAANFGMSELGEVMAFLHERGMEGYMCINTLVFDNEIAHAISLVRAAAQNGVDAIIVQDYGMAKLAREVAPGLPVHASTQMSVTDGHGAEFVASSIGCETVVVGRELSTEDIATVSAALRVPAMDSEREEAGRMENVRVEAFVHGALCVSYSGQCFSSEAWGGRSANRGQCAQACRMPYGLVVDGELQSFIDDARYMLSPQDLMAVDRVRELVLAGVDTFKIEGRLKGPEYVYMTTAAYRHAVDAAWEELCGEFPPHVAQRTAFGESPRRNFGLSSKAPVVPSRSELAQVFARGQDEAYDGLSTGFLDGPNHQMVVRGRAPKHRGVLVGTVLRVNRASRRQRFTEVLVDVRSEVKPGDGLVIDSGNPDEEEVGGAVYTVERRRRPSPSSEMESEGVRVLTFGKDFEAKLRASGRGVNVGDLVWRTRDPALEKRVQSWIRGVHRRTDASSASEDTGQADGETTSPAQVRVFGELGQPLVIELRDLVTGATSRAATPSALTSADRKPVLEADVVRALGSLGGSPFHLEGQPEFEHRLHATLQPGAAQPIFVSMKDVKAARRSALESLGEQVRGFQEAAVQAGVRMRTDGLLSQDDAEAIVHGLPEMHRRSSSQDSTPLGTKLSVLCRSRSQVDAASVCADVDEIIIDFLEAKGVAEAIEAVRQAPSRSGSLPSHHIPKRVVVASPRIIKPAEELLWMWLLDLGADALLVRSPGLLKQLVDARGKSLRSTSTSPGAATPAPSFPALLGDFSLNAANKLTAELLLNSGGLERLCPTHDLNAEQLAGLAGSLDAGHAAKLEVIAHQHLPIFHTEHCVFCRFLSNGTSFKDCGHPCERNTVHLRSTEGEDHVVMADMGCRNTVFNSKAQTAASYLDWLCRAGFRSFRIELVDEPPEVVAPLVERYRTAIERANSLVEGACSADSDVNVLESEYWRAVEDLTGLLATVPDSNGRTHGFTDGSLAPAEERPWSSLRPTARR